MKIDLEKCRSCSYWNGLSCNLTACGYFPKFENIGEGRAKDFKIKTTTGALYNFGDDVVRMDMDLTPRGQVNGIDVFEGSVRAREVHKLDIYTLYINDILQTILVLNVKDDLVCGIIPSEVLKLLEELELPFWYMDIKAVVLSIKEFVTVKVNTCRWEFIERNKQINEWIKEILLEGYIG